ncbi:hypothetical protein [Arthrobacter monumenti]
MSNNYDGVSGSTASSSQADVDNNAESEQRRARVGTVVWGLIIIALAGILILAEVATISLDFGQVMIGLLIGAGLALVIGGLISAKNREKDDKQP